MAQSKLEHKPNDNAVKTKFGWQDGTTGELLVSAVGAFTAVDVDVSRPNNKIEMQSANTAPKTPKRGKGQTQAPKEAPQGQTEGASGV